MKRIFVFMLAMCMIFSLAACDSDKPIETQPTETLPPTEPTVAEPIAKYESDVLKLLSSKEYSNIQGYVDDLITYGIASEMFRVDNVLHCKESNGWNKQWSKLTLSDNYEIMLFEQSAVTVAESHELIPNGVIRAYIKYGRDEETGEYGLPTVELKCTKDQFVYGYNPSGNADYDYAYMYMSQNRLCYIYYDVDAGTTSPSSVMECQVGDTFVEIHKFASNEDRTAWVVTDSDGNLYKIDPSVEIKDKSAIVIADANLTIAGVDQILSVGKDGVFVTKKDDVSHVYYFPVVTEERLVESENKEDEDKLETVIVYGQPIKVTLPEGYNTEDIIHLDINDNVMVVLKDNICAIADKQLFKVGQDGAVFEKLDMIEALAKEGKVVKVAQTKNKILVLMDDGFVYEIVR